MKFNLLYPLLLAAVLGCLWIVRDLQGQSGNTFFGTAETESRSINMEYTALVKTIYVRSGQQVKKGDTLAIVTRSELDKNFSENRVEAEQLRTERDAQNALLGKDRDLLNVQYAAERSELEAEINLLETEMALQANLRKALGSEAGKNDPPTANLKAQEIKGLREAIVQNEKKRLEELQHVDYQIKTNNSICEAKLKELRSNRGFLDLERGQLVLLASMDGFIEQVGAAPNEVVQQYRELFKINPRQPSKVIGFLHESFEFPLQLGDTVLLSSASRTNVQCPAILNGVSSKMVELPFRLRKFAEVKTWGRELYIKLPDDNPFYIGEKIMITLKLQ